MVNLDLKLDLTNATNWLGRLPAQVRIRLLAAMAENVQELATRVQATAPVGGAGDRHPGKLRRSVKGKVTEDGRGVTGIVSANFVARFIEQGVQGTFTVRPYARRAPNGVAVVKGFSRTMNTPPRPFMGPAYRSMQQRIEQSLAKAVQGVADER